uniref:Uncharacterized protein n=1 Tax=Helianthus annuus TaxID=4232 RepID=A0A251RQJ5_HELAN
MKKFVGALHLSTSSCIELGRVLRENRRLYVFSEQVSLIGSSRKRFRLCEQDRFRLSDHVGFAYVYLYIRAKPQGLYIGVPLSEP